VRVLVTDCFKPDAAAPARGSFVRDQVAALRRLGLDVEHVSFPPGWRTYPSSVRRLRGLLREEPFDLVHAHYGLTGWFARLAGAPRIIVTFHGTDVRHAATGALSRRLVRRLELVAVASRALFGPEGSRPGLPRVTGARAVLPCGADLSRFVPRSRSEARRRLGLDPHGRYLLFPAAPDRTVKRHDRAAEVARRTGADLLSAGSIAPEAMPDLVNAAAAVLITSENEGFGLGAVEALACNVPVLSTPVGIAPTLLRGLEGCLCAPFDAGAWGQLAGHHLDASDARVEGIERARWFSAERMAERLEEVYRELLIRNCPSRPGSRQSA
jgi:glycosyltransferase involved in cell wall biosynthesis